MCRESSIHSTMSINSARILSKSPIYCISLQCDANAKPSTPVPSIETITEHAAKKSVCARDRKKVHLNYQFDAPAQNLGANPNWNRVFYSTNAQIEFAPDTRFHHSVKLLQPLPCFTAITHSVFLKLELLVRGTAISGLRRKVSSFAVCLSGYRA